MEEGTLAKQGDNRHSRPDSESGLTLADIGIDKKQGQRAQRIGVVESQNCRRLAALLHTSKCWNFVNARPKVGAVAPDDQFTVKQMIELCKCKTERDAKRVAKKAIALAKKNRGTTSIQVVTRSHHLFRWLTLAPLLLCRCSVLLPSRDASRDAMTLSEC